MRGMKKSTNAAGILTRAALRIPRPFYLLISSASPYRLLRSMDFIQRHATVIKYLYQALGR
jgi:hypothetical protein